MTFPNLHPQFVHFPIAGAVFLVALSFISLFFKKEKARVAARWLLPFATLGALGAVSTGLLYEKLFPHPHEGAVHELMELHENIGLVIAGLFLLLTFFAFLTRKKITRSVEVIFFLGALILVGLVGYTGYLGGELGHTHRLAIPSSEERPHSHSSSEAPSSQEVAPSESQKKEPEKEHHHEDHPHSH